MQNNAFALVKKAKNKLANRNDSLFKKRLLLKQLISKNGRLREDIESLANFSREIRKEAALNKVYDEKAKVRNNSTLVLLEEIE